MAVLYRAHAQSRALEEELVKNNISYQIFGGTKFYERKEIKDILAYLKILINKDDDVSLARIINVPKRGIGVKAGQRLKNLLLIEDCLYMMFCPILINTGLTPRAIKQLKDFKILMEQFHEKLSTSAITEITSHILNETGYLEALIQEDTVEAETRREYLREFLNVTTNYDQKNPAGS